jgi:major vault protein
MSSEGREKRDLALAPGTYAYLQDLTKGAIKTYTGPCIINQTAQETPVVYNSKRGTFEPCRTLEDAVRKSPIAVEGYYLILLNPVKGNGEPCETGIEGKTSPDLNVGRKVNIPGPAMFPLWPGQHAEHVKGHHLRSNQYLLVRIYNEEEARKNWAKAVVKPASGTEEDTEAVVTSDVPEDLTVGRLLIIRGTEVSFYIPPTGVSVVAEAQGDPDEEWDGKLHYVREALTLERLEYCVLIDEDGNKRYERGPQVVFPKPTEKFMVDKRKGKKFRAIELNEIQGLHIKVVAPYTEKSGEERKEGDEIFLTGKDQAIYFPREEHSLISYDGKSKHFATAVPAGEARYIMDRITGEIETKPGPDMLLPDPRSKVIIRRVLSDKQCKLWYPGNDEALEYNRHLRSVLQQAPTTRAGAISEGDLSRSARSSKGARKKALYKGIAMESSISGDQELQADEFVRSATYTEPRMVTLNTKFQGVPNIDIFTGYAVLIVSKTGERRVEVGPKTILLDYDEALEVLEMSTGKPKNTDKLLQTVYLRVANNKVADIVDVETKDHVKVAMKLSHKVNFEGDPNKWFQVENYVKFLCDHVRSVLKGAIKRLTIAEFYANSVGIIRDIMLGVPSAEGEERPGMAFTENGMRIQDVEVLKVRIEDDRIQSLLDQAQHEAVQSNIEIERSQRALDATRQTQSIERERLDEEAKTKAKLYDLQTNENAMQLKVLLEKLSGEIEQQQKKLEAEQEHQKVTDVAHDAELGREKRSADQAEAINIAVQARELEHLKAQTDAVVARFGASQEGFSEALLALSNNETVVKVSEALSVQKLIGGQNFTEAVQRLFADTPLKHVMDRVVREQPVPSNGGKPSRPHPRP